ncbi:MAG: C10 family peptidase [Paludibacteraceae bacterium]|nr:C10 family peptidase [Paludibacteraceae bacterium]
MKQNFKKVAYLLPLFTVAALGSCNDENMNDESVAATGNEKVLDEKVLSLSSKNHRLSIDEAMKYAMKADEVIGVEGNGLKSCKQKSIANVSVLTIGNANGLKSSSAKKDTTAYVFNFANDEGFAIVSADDRIGEPVIAYIEKGSYNAESPDNMQDIMMTNVNDYVANSINKYEAEKDLLNTEVVAGEANAQKSLKSSKATLLATYTRGPLLTTRWGQHYEYNDAIERATGRDYLVGCCAVACSQVMGYYKTPYFVRSKGNIYSMNWTDIMKNPYINSTSDPGVKDLQNLLYQVARGIDTDFGLDGSSSNLRHIRDFLENNQYDVTKRNYDAEKVAKYINNNRPVIIDGRKALSSSAHCWVIDGLKQMKYRYRGSTVVVSYFHHNWGWYGNNNGWFKVGVFDPDEYSQLDGVSTTGHNDYRKSNDCLYITKK